MDSLRVFWSEWAETLRVRGIDGFVAWILEAAGPLNILGAQLLYIARPLIFNPSWDQRAQAVAHLLEDEEESRAFIEYLKGQTP
jgi:hypothetical protein